MKTLVVILLALGIGFAGAYVIVSKQKDAEIAKIKAESQPQPVAEAAPKTVEKVVMVPAPAPVEESPQDILNDLLDVKLGSGSERNAGLRLVVFKLETLTHRRAAAVPAIRTFLAHNVDVGYSQQDNQSETNAIAGNGGNAGQNNNGTNNNRGFNRNNGGGFGGFAGGGGRNGARRARNLENLRTDWVVPPSLRLGLVGALKEIGGVEAEQTLADMLNSTGRGVEIAYLTVMLEELAPGKYRSAAIKAAMNY